MFSYSDCSIVGIAQKSVFDDHTCFSSRFQYFDKMLQKERGSFTCFYREVLLHFGTFLTTKRRISKDHVITVFFLYVGQVFCQCVGVDDVGSFYTMKNHIHNANDVGQ